MVGTDRNGCIQHIMILIASMIHSHGMKRKEPKDHDDIHHLSYRDGDQGI